jgi:hypothetical protein
MTRMVANVDTVTLAPFLHNARKQRFSFDQLRQEAASVIATSKLTILMIVLSSHSCCDTRILDLSCARGNTAQVIVNGCS